MKFFKMENNVSTNGTLINIETIGAIIPYTAREWINLNKINAAPYSIAELRGFGFNVVDYTVEWHICDTYEEAKAIAMKDATCFTSPMWQNKGYYKMRKVAPYVSDTRREGLETAIGRADIREEKNEYYFLPESMLDKPFVYVVHLTVPSGGMNNDHLKFDITVDDYRRLENYIA